VKSEKTKTHKITKENTKWIWWKVKKSLNGREMEGQNSVIVDRACNSQFVTLINRYSYRFLKNQKGQLWDGVGSLRILHLPVLHVYTWVETRWGFGEIIGTYPALPSTCGSISVHGMEATDLGPQFTGWKALTATPPRRLNHDTQNYSVCIVSVDVPRPSQENK
jgi:hypothetical protein